MIYKSRLLQSQSEISTVIIKTYSCFLVMNLYSFINLEKIFDLRENFKIEILKYYVIERIIYFTPHMKNNFSFLCLS